MIVRLLILLSLPFTFLSSVVSEQSEQRIRMIYSSIDPKSVAQNIAFNELYSNHPLGQKALQVAWELLSIYPESPQGVPGLPPFSTSMVSSLVNLINRSNDQEIPVLSPDSQSVLESLATRLNHYKLAGHRVWNVQQILELPIDEVDLSRAIFIHQFGDDRNKIKFYEAQLDLMALQIAARLPETPLPEQKVEAINHFVFEEMGFRFPPQSLYSKDVDAYTVLPTVIDSHRGVCLGVSILYLSLAQRLSLPLEIITPPGHIYIRYRDSSRLINIETTARGMHIDSEEYLSIEVKSLQERNIKEVIGLSDINQASYYLQNDQYDKALQSYQSAALYLPSDPLVKELMGYSYLFLGQEKEARQLLNQIKDHVPDYAVSKETMAEDFLNGNVDASSLQTTIRRTEKDRLSILSNKQQLEDIIERYPKFRIGILQLASAWMELHRTGEALEVLKKYHALNPNNPSVEFYLAELYIQRYDFNRAWEHLHFAEEILQSKNYRPKELLELRKQLTQCCPE